jgi:hypothetical protein
MLGLRFIHGEKREVFEKSQATGNKLEVFEKSHATGNKIFLSCSLSAKN